MNETKRFSIDGGEYSPKCELFNPAEVGSSRYVEIIDLTDDDNFVIDSVTNEKITYEDSIILMNELSRYKEKVENTVIESIKTERTALGLSTLKNLADNLNIEYGDG